MLVATVIDYYQSRAQYQTRDTSSEEGIITDGRNRVGDGNNSGQSGNVIEGVEYLTESVTQYQACDSCLLEDSTSHVSDGIRYGYCAVKRVALVKGEASNTTQSCPQR